MVTVILIRHGDTDWNQEQVFRGTIDVPLNQTGLAQARAAGQALAEIPIDALYASPLARAFETAQALAEGRGIAVTTEDGLNDIDFGLWQGMSKDEVIKEHPDLYRTWLTDPQLVTFPRGENLLKVQKRAMAALERAMDSNPGKTIALVSHRVVTKVMLCGVLGLELSCFWRVKQDTCALNRFIYDDGSYCLTLLNDTCHLKGIAGASAADF